MNGRSEYRNKKHDGDKQFTVLWDGDHDDHDLPETETGRVKGMSDIKTTDGDVSRPWGGGQRKLVKSILDGPSSWSILDGKGRDLNASLFGNG